MPGYGAYDGQPLPESGLFQEFGAQHQPLDLGMAAIDLVGIAGQLGCP